MGKLAGAWIKRDHLSENLCQQAGELTCAATDVQGARSAVRQFRQTGR